MPSTPPLIGSYSAPAVKRGEVVTCLYRDCDCFVTVMSAAPIPWPRVQPRGKQGGSGLWVNEELRRAILTESAEALKYHFGVSANVVWKWRKQFGVGGHATTKGSKRANRAASQRGAAAAKAKVWTAKERRARSRLSKRLGLKPTGRWKGKEWTEEQLALLGTDHDEAIARKIGRTRGAGTSKRVALKIPAYSGWAGGGRGWGEEEIALLGTGTDAAIARKIGRTWSAVMQKRVALRIAAFRSSAARS
jgi:transposase-like protein